MIIELDMGVRVNRRSASVLSGGFALLRRRFEYIHDVVVNQFFVEVGDLALVELRRRTPVLTGRMRANWHIKLRLTGINITNATPYAWWICFGARSPHRGQIVEPALDSAVAQIDSGTTTRGLVGIEKV